MLRLEEAVDDLNASTTAEQFRAAVEAIKDPELRAKWKAESDQTEGRVTPQTNWAVGLAKYFLLLVAAQLDKCVGLLPSDDLPRFSDPELLRDLRNFDEHWENPAGPSGTRLRAQTPDIVPGRLRFTNKHIWIEEIHVLDILEWAHEVDRRVRQLATEAGRPIPPSDWYRVEGN